MVRMHLSIMALIAVSVLVGMVVGPIFFPRPLESEIYIPNGKGDILIGNVSRNQATVIFKTLDSANGNKPLATTATVEFYQDPEYTKLVRRTNEHDYAVTHIIPVDSLQENVLYYIKIIAKDTSSPQHTKEISLWGDGSDPIKVYTAGDIVSGCAQKTTQVANDGGIDVGSERTSDLVEENEQKLNNPELEATEVVRIPGNAQDQQQKQNETLKIDNVLNENHLQPQNKIQTLISWTTNIPASSVLIYGEQNSAQKVQLNLNNQMQTKHLAVLTTLKAGTVYYFNVQSKDKDGNIATSAEYSLRTPRPQHTVLEKIADNFMGLVGQVKPR